MVIRKVKCLRCGHEWFPRTEDTPISCPNVNCRSVYWNKPRRVKKEPEVLKFNRDYAIDIICGDNPEYSVISDKVIDYSKCGASYEVIIMRNSDGIKFKSFYFNDGPILPYEGDKYAEFVQI